MTAIGNCVLRNILLGLASLLVAPWAALAADAPLELKVSDGAMIRNAKPEPLNPLKDFFSTGRDGVNLVGAGDIKTQMQFKCTNVPEGDYYPALLIGSQTYLCEFVTNWAHLYLNDTRLPWTGRSVALRPETASDKNFYQTQLRAERIHVKPTDILRVVYPPTGGNAIIGSLFLQTEPFTDSIVKYPVYNPAKVDSYWLNAGLDEPQRSAGEVAQGVWFCNPGVLPRTFNLAVAARDFFLKDLLGAKDETILLAPGERITRTYKLPLGTSGRVRLSLEATAEGVFPPIHLVKFYLDDVTAGARPSSLMLNSDWEQCFVKGAEPGAAPPADAKWTAIKVPYLAEDKDAHCIWLRKTFKAPDYIQGERVLLHFLMCMSESRLYVNGKEVHYQPFGTEPFEADITSAFKPGQDNQLLIAVRDWIAYSKRNQQRVRDGEEPIFKDCMDAPAGYKASGGWGGCIGIGRPVYLEARPAVSVDDVFVVTSLRDKKLTLKYRLVNKSAIDQQVALSATVLEGGQPVKKLPDKTVTVPAGKSETVSVEQGWSDAKLWWPGQPNLYVLQTDLKPSSGASDRHLVRFGFRDIWIDGISFIVNGVRMKIRSQWTSPASGIDSTPQEPDKRLEDLWVRQSLAMIDNDTQLTRTHNQVGVEEQCDIADELGLMIKVENGSTAQQGFTFDQGYWNQLVASELRVVDAYKNHASVFLWSAGNENMWGWLYQGEAAKTLGNRWQIKAVKAMRELDLMARPIEWEADGDLMGAWESHATHYPREIQSAQDLPVGAWWGPLDKKTVIPYSMGPITLGEKPITTGESVGPDSYGHPFGQSILLGDNAYLGGSYQWLGWFVGSKFIIDGFRDAQFALIDTYAPNWMQPPQTVVFKEYTYEFVGGQTLTRNLNVHNDVLRKARLTLKWTLDTFGGERSTLDQGEQTLDLNPAELARLAIKVKLPSFGTQRRVAVFMVTLSENGQIVHRERQGWLIFEKPAVTMPQGLGLSLYDPEGKTAAMLTALKVPFTLVPMPKAPPAGGAMIIGRDALKQPPQGPWREELDTFVKGGGKVLIFEQSEAPDCLPAPLAQARKSKSTYNFIRAADHPILSGMTDGDFRWWVDDHYVSANNYRKPLEGSFLPLVDVGTMDGMLESSLMEEYSGKGSYILCQLLLTDKALTAPPATRLLQNLLNYLASPTAYRTSGKTGVLAGAQAPMRKMLDDAHVIYEDLSDQSALDGFKVVLVDAATGLDGPAGAAWAGRLNAFASAGGTVMVHRAAPAQQPLLESMLGVKLRFRPVAKEATDAQNRIQRCAASGLVGGISNHDFFWATRAYLENMRDNGKWWGCFDPRPPEECIAEYYCQPAEIDAAKATELTRPCALLAVPCGSGRFVLSQLRIDQPCSDAAPTANRLRSLLLTNLGCTVKSAAGGGVSREQRLGRYDFFTVDLAKYANRGLKDDKAAGIVGWTNQAENDMRNLPVGKQLFAGVPFEIASPRSAVALYSASGLNNKDLPKEVKGIVVGHRGDALFFLHSMAYGNDVHPFKYHVNYADGSGLDIAIENGKQVFDWWSDPATYIDTMAQGGTVIGWRGDNSMHKGLTILLYEWANPSPQKEIASVDFLTVPESLFAPVPILVGLSGATMRSDQGLVVDVIGTAGLKVKLGTQVTDVYYIGVAGLAKEHPFYEQAVAAHKAMVVGKTVQVVDDVVTKNQAAQRVAYVFLAGEQDYMLNNLVNARIIGDGLGKLGNFEGNNRHRMYLENLQMITQAGKKGLWAKEK